MSRGELVCLGRIVKPHGLRGEVKVLPGSGDPTSLRGFERLWLRRESRLTLVKVEGWWAHDRLARLRLAGCTDRDRAESLRGAELLAERDWLPEPGEGEYYFHDLIGRLVVEENGRELGRVRDVLGTGAQGLLRIPHPDLGELLIPYVEAFIVEEDGERIVMRLPAGLVDLDEAD